MKGSKKLLVLLVVLFATLGFVGCGGDTTTETTQTTEATVETTQSTEAPADLAAALEALKTNYADTLESVTFVATEDLTLVASMGGADVAWTSGNTDYLTNDGTVTRPTFTDGDQTVVLTATLSNGVDADVTYQFFVTISALPKSDAERAEDVFLVVTAFPDKDYWTSADNDTLDFLTSGVDGEGTTHTVVWTSSDETVISVAGEITQPEDADVVVTMTATITINGVDFTRDVEFTVAKLEAGTPVSTIAEIKALGEEAYIEIAGVTVVSILDDGSFFFTDGVDIIQVYQPGFEVIVGNVYDITGEFTWYYHSPELVGTTTHPIRAKESTAAAVTAPTEAETTVAAIVASLTTPSETSRFAYKSYTITAKVYVDESWGNYSVFLVPTDYDFGAAVTGTQPNGDSIMIYYKSNMDALKGLHGEEVTIEIITLGWRSDKFVWYAGFFGDLGDIAVNFADDQATADAALNTATVGIPTEVIDNATFEIYTNIFGATITYASTDETLVSLTGAIDGSTTTTQVAVTLTVTADFNGTIATEDITILVGELPVSTIPEAQAAAIDTKLRVQGVVIASEYQNTYMIQDENGVGIALYTYDADMKAFLEANIGNKVEAIGDRAVYHDLMQLSLESVVLVEESTLPAAMNLDAVAEEDFMDYQNTLVEFTDLYVVDLPAQSYGNVLVIFERISDGTQIAMKWDSRVDLSTEAAAALAGIAVGDKVTVVAGMGWYDAIQLYYTSSTVITEGTPYTDAELLAADAARFEAAVTTSVDYVLPELLYTDSVAVAIAVELQPYLVDDLAASDTLEVTLPNGDVTGNVTFTLTKGTDTVDVVVALTLDGLTDAEKLSADQAALTIELTAYAQQTVVLPLTEALGSAIAWTVVSGDATLDVDGQTLTFNESAVNYDVVLQASLSIGSETPVTKDFTVVVTGYVAVTDFSTLYTELVVPGTWDVPNGVDMFFQGVVIEFGYNAMYLVDANGVGLKVSGNTYGDLSIGDEIILMGQLEDDNGVRQLDWNPALINVVSTGNAVAAISMTADEVIAIDVTNTAQLITIADSVTLAGTGTYYTFTVTGSDGTTTVILSTHSSNLPDWFDDAFGIGDTVGELTFVFSKFYNADLTIESITLEQRDVDRVNGDAAQLEDDLYLSDDYTLPATVYGSTFTVTAVSAELTAYIDYTTTPGTLIVTAPAVAAVGTVTVQVEYGLETLDVVLDVSVGPALALPVYTTGFETGDGFTASTSYTGGLSDVNGWTVVEGTVTTTDASTEDMHLQMRDYSSVAGFPYAEFHDGTIFNSITFNAFSNQSSGFQLVVQFSTDGTTWSTGTTVDMTTTDTTFTVNSDVVDATYVRLTVNHSVTPDKQRVTIDDINLFA